MKVSLTNYIDKLDLELKENIFNEIVDDDELYDTFEAYSQGIIGIMASSPFNTLISVDAKSLKTLLWRFFVQGYISNSLRQRKALDYNADFADEDF